MQINLYSNFTWIKLRSTKINSISNVQRTVSQFKMFMRSTYFFVLVGLACGLKDSVRLNNLFTFLNCAIMVLVIVCGSFHRKNDFFLLNISIYGINRLMTSQFYILLGSQSISKIGHYPNLKCPIGQGKEVFGHTAFRARCKGRRRVFTDMQDSTAQLRLARK